MSQGNSKPNPQEDTLPQLIFMVLGGVVLLTFLPVMVFSMIFAWLLSVSLLLVGMTLTTTRVVWLLKVTPHLSATINSFGQATSLFPWL